MTDPGEWRPKGHDSVTGAKGLQCRHAAPLARGQGNQYILQTHCLHPCNKTLTRSSDAIQLLTLLTSHTSECRGPEPKSTDANPVTGCICDVLPPCPSDNAFPFPLSHIPSHHAGHQPFRTSSQHLLESKSGAFAIAAMAASSDRGAVQCYSAQVLACQPPDAQ